MEFNTKFYLGQQVYLIDTEKIMNKGCNSCNGNGKVEAKIISNGLMINCKCPTCNGTGNVLSKRGNQWSSKCLKKVKEDIYIGNTLKLYPDTDIAKCSFYINSICIRSYDAEEYICVAKYGDGLTKEVTVFNQNEIFANKEDAIKYCEEFNSIQEFS